MVQFLKIRISNEISKKISGFENNKYPILLHYYLKYGLAFYFHREQQK
jgi:hypothetical protein